MTVTEPTPGHERRVIRKAACCGRDVLERETAQEWAKAEMAHHGPPPERLLAKVRAIAKAAAARP